MLLMLINVSEDIDKSEECIEELEIISDVRSYSWETEFIIIDWLDVSTVMKADIKSVTERVLTECISVKNAEDC